MAQKVTLLGARDPRLDASGRIDLRLRRQLRHYEKVDPPPRRLRPIPIEIIHHAVNMVHCDPHASASRHATADLLCLAFFFLLRPGEYCKAPDASDHPFRWEDIQLWRHHTPLPLQTASKEALFSATRCSLTFTTQKNTTRGEQVGHAPSGHPIFCPCRAIARRVWHLRLHQAPAGSPIDTYYHHLRGAPFRVTAAQIGQALKLSRDLLQIDFPRADCVAKALRASGAMACIAARIDSDLVRLLGRWQSDAMLRYFHVEHAPVTHRHAAAMFSRGSFQC